jgi:uncharacterized protein (TIGR03000 family)
MFSAVLMVAMTTTDMTPDFGRRRGGCHGCYGGGGCCGSCYGGGCYGGGYGGCYGGGYGGCYGGGYGGCYGGMGGCYGGGCGGGGAYRVMSGYYGSYSGMPYTEYMPPDGGRRERIDGDRDRTDGDRERGDRDRTGNREKVSQPTPARIVVQLPADATLTIDGLPTKSTSDQHVFASPPLQPGRTFYYTFKATVLRDGRPVTSEERVQVRAGEETRVKLDLPTTVLTRR